MSKRRAAYVAVVTVEVPVTLTGTEDEFLGAALTHHEVQDRALDYLRTRLPARMTGLKMQTSGLRSTYVHPEQIGDEGALPTDGYRVPLSKVLA